MNIEYGIGVNVQTGETRNFEMHLDELRDITFDVEFDHCTGDCECQVETDGTCPEGWPSRMSALGFV